MSTTSEVGGLGSDAASEEFSTRLVILAGSDVDKHITSSLRLQRKREFFLGEDKHHKHVVATLYGCEEHSHLFVLELKELKSQVESTDAISFVDDLMSSIGISTTEILILHGPLQAPRGHLYDPTKNYKSMLYLRTSGCGRQLGEGVERLPVGLLLTGIVARLIAVAEMKRGSLLLLTSLKTGRASASLSLFQKQWSFIVSFLCVSISPPEDNENTHILFKSLGEADSLLYT